jgi:hypothetical protein
MSTAMVPSAKGRLKHVFKVDVTIRPESECGGHMKWTQRQ